MSQSEQDAPVWSPLEFSRGSLLNNIFTVAVLLFWGRATLYALNQEVPQAKYGAVFLGLGLLIYILNELYEVEKENRLERIGLWICAIIGVGTPVYVWMNYEVLETIRVGYALPHEYALGGVFTLVVLYLTYRAFGSAFAGVLLLTIGYAFFGNVIPGLFGHGGIAARQIVNLLTMEFDGFFGNITQIVATEVALFLLYAGLMQGFGAFQLIMRVALKAGNYVKSGVAQSAVISSLAMGSINGAQTANAAMTGSFTIPLMKDSGLKGKSAGGIEAVASAGGQIMPPVMGAAAFVMASLVTDIGYVDVLVAGIIPALVFYISVAIGVHYTAVGQLPEGGVNMTDAMPDLDERYHPAIETVRFVVPFAVLIYTLGIAQWTVASSALYTSAVMILTGAGIPILLALIRDEEDVSRTGQNMLKDTISGFKSGAITTAPIVVIIAAVNGIVDLLNATGIPGKLSLAIITLGGGILLLTVVFAMVICLIMGLGMPTVAAYTIVAILIAPTLVGQFGIPALSAHFFVFYAAILSGITPPIAISVVVTAGIAESNFWQTSIEALKLAIPLFVLPFTFIYRPEIVTGGISLLTLFSGVVVLLGAIAIAHGLNYSSQSFSFPSSLNYGIRAIYVALGIFAMVWPGIVLSTAIGLAALVLIAFQEGISPLKRISALTKSDETR
jgi:TRAP transporter 4TM/12TM fusion protein